MVKGPNKWEQQGWEVQLVTREAEAVWNEDETKIRNIELVKAEPAQAAMLIRLAVEGDIESDIPEVEKSKSQHELPVEAGRGDLPADVAATHAADGRRQPKLWS